MLYHDKTYEEAHHERTQLQEQEDSRVSNLLDERIREETEKERLKAEELAKAVASESLVDGTARCAPCGAHHRELCPVAFLFVDVARRDGLRAVQS